MYDLSELANDSRMAPRSRSVISPGELTAFDTRRTLARKRQPLCGVMSGGGVLSDWETKSSYDVLCMPRVT